MKRWKLLNQQKVTNKKKVNENIIKLLLANRGISSKKDIDDYLNPNLENISFDSVGIGDTRIKKFLERIISAITKKEQIIVYGDYDVDGITGTAILWEVLNRAGAKVLPFIPDRVDEGYGLSIAGINKLISKTDNIKLIITVDNGIVANEAINYANSKGIEVIITDHHTVGKTLPDAGNIIHTTTLCGAGIAYLLSKAIKNKILHKTDLNSDDHLELAALGTVADMVPLLGPNRAIVKYGLEKLAFTTRPGLIELYKNAGCEKNVFSCYEVGFIIAPRLNASGRIENAMDSLRLLCTKDRLRAKKLADKLEETNKERQFLMKEAAEDSILRIKNQETNIKKILIVSHENYNQGIIGLVAGKLVEEFYRPSIVISIGETHSKASVRSVEGFNIIEFLRSKSEYFVNVGGHPMAAGFTIETSKLTEFQTALELAAESTLDPETLKRQLKIDLEIPFELITQELYSDLQKMAPFGMKNPEPVFCSSGLKIMDLRILGQEGKHLKLKLKSGNSESVGFGIDAIGFGMGQRAGELAVGDSISAAYTIDQNTWNGSTNLQLKLKDIRLN